MLVWLSHLVCYFIPRSLRLRGMLLVGLTVVFGAGDLVYAARQQMSNQRPRLVVGLVIDQMRWDYLYRYADRYGKGGFKRLLREGFTCENANINYVPAFTACGHASIYTGSVPAIHGITGNEWVNRKSGYQQYCTGDTSVYAVGSESKAGNMSPRNLLTTTIGDELKLATNFKAKVVGIAVKDRGSILPAGHAADVAYWFDEVTGNWITSSYYKTELPEWVKAFNIQKLPAKYLTGSWNTLYPIDTYTSSTQDDSPYEGAFPQAGSPVFPHRFAPGQVPQLHLLKTSPFANTLTFEFSKKAIEGEELGMDDVTDLLTISLSATDYIGHQFGPNSVEIEDTYLRLDRELEHFLEYLDKVVGKNKYTFFLTADHGAAHNASYLADNKIPSGFWDARKLHDTLNRHLAERYAVEYLIKPFLNYQLHLNYDVINKNKIDIEELEKDCIRFIQQQQGVAYVFDFDDVGRSLMPFKLREKIVNGYYNQRSGAIQLILEPGWFQLSNNTKGTIHGSWNPYDSHIPIIFMGRGIKKGIYRKPVTICDIAPTISTMLHIQEPNGNIGRTIKEALK